MAIEPAERFTPATLDAALDAFRRDGVVVIDGVADVAMLDARREALPGLYPQYFSAVEEANRYYVSTGRFYASLAIDGPFADPALFASPALLPFLEGALGEGFVLDSFGIINALPGAAEQQWHRDGGVLFPESPVERMLPAAAITLAMPLVEMNDAHGSTGFSLGSHRRPDPGELDCVPTVPVGSCALWDYRVFHKGMENCSTAARPLVYAVYCRPWWIDVGNFNGGAGEKMVVGKAALAALDPALQKMLARATVR
jgi:hypothetical protein